MNERDAEKLPESPADLISSPEDLNLGAGAKCHAVKVSRVISGLPVYVKYVEDRIAKLERVAKAAKLTKDEPWDCNECPTGCSSDCPEVQLTEALAALDADA